MGLLRTLFFVIVGYYVIRFVIRLFAPLFGYQHISRRSSGQYRQEARPEGDVRVVNNNRQHPHNRRDEGEYIDFEEIS